MKKIFAAIMAIMIMSSVTFAQKSSVPKARPTATTEHKSASKIKKDGTPDKRFKENKKSTTTTTTHLKKDGTPDRRFKENK